MSDPDSDFPAAFPKTFTRPLLPSRARQQAICAKLRLVSASKSTLFFITALSLAQTVPKPYRLQTENRVDPIGIDVAAPRLSWNLNWPGAMQQAYEVRAASSPALLERGFADLWNTGRVESTKTQGIVYNGTALRSRDSVAWQVRVWSMPATGTPSEWSDPAFWEMGLLNQSDWQAQSS